MWQEVTTVTTAKHAFRRAGIFPLDINNIDAPKLAPADVAVAQPAIDPQPVLIAPQPFVAQALPACVIQPRLHIDNPVTVQLVTANLPSLVQLLPKLQLPPLRIVQLMRGGPSYTLMPNLGRSILPSLVQLLPPSLDQLIRCASHSSAS